MRSATIFTISAEPSIPLFVAAAGRSPASASIWRATRVAGSACHAWTPSVFWAVTEGGVWVIVEVEGECQVFELCLGAGAGLAGWDQFAGAQAKLETLTFIFNLHDNPN